MRRPLVAGVGVVLALAAMPLAARALGAPDITIQSPTANDIVVGELAIDWTYQGFSPAAWVDIEASRDGGPFQRITRTRIDDGTPGRKGSATWSTTPADDSANLELRLVVPSNKQIRSSVSPVVVDNTAPEGTEASRTAANDAGWNNGDVTVTWACTDAASGPVDPEVDATVTDEGVDLTAAATCTDNAGHSTTVTAEGIDIDRTGPATTISTTNTDENPSISVLTGVSGSATDGLSGIAEVVVSFVDEAGNETRRSTVCGGCGGGNLASWGVNTQGLAPGLYRVTAIAVDVAGNEGTASEDFLIVGAPDVTVPPVTPPETTVSQPTVPEPTVPEPTVPVTLPTLELPA